MSNWEEAINEARRGFSHFQNLPFRQSQTKILLDILNHKDKYIYIKAPMGVGKSLMGMVLCSLNSPATYLCSTKMLQEQLQKDFPEARVMMGRSNFPCLRLKMLTAENCTHTKGNPCQHFSRCPYRVQKKIVAAHPIKILNYPYYINECFYAGEFGNNRLVVCDEADLMEKAVIGFINVTITPRMQDELRLTTPAYKTFGSESLRRSWDEWCGECIDKTTKRLHEFTSKLERATYNEDVDGIARWGRRVKGCENLVSRMSLMKANLQADWIWENKDGRWVFRPLWITKQLADRTFYAFGERFIIMSATLPPVNVASFLLGADEKEGYGVEVDHPFPAGNRPVIVRPRYTLIRSTFESEAERILQAHREVFDAHPNEKILVHAVSYKLARLILSIGNGRMITHTAEDKEQAIQSFKESPLPLIMVSPSLTRGIDLPDDLTRVIVWSKAPYLSLGDEVTKRRANYGKFGNVWYKCFPTGTHVLCENEIKEVQDICVGDRVWSVDTKTHKMRVNTVTDTWSNEYVGSMHNIYNRSVSLTCTNNHKIMIRYGGRKTINERLAGSIINPGNGISLLLPSNIDINRTDTRTIDVSAFRKPERFYYSGRKHSQLCSTERGRKNSKMEFVLDDFVSLLGWYITEGSIANNTCTIYQHSNVNNMHAIEINKLLTRMELRPTTTTKYSSFCHREVVSALLHFGGKMAGGKVIDKKFLESLTTNQIKILFHTMMKGDGTKRVCSFIGYYNTDSYVYTTKSYNLALQVAWMAYILGRRALIRKKETYFTINLPRRRNTFQKLQTRTIENYDGLIHGITVDRDHNYFAGSDGSLVLVGNSEACQALMQGCGRGVRHENDYAVTYCLDDKIKELILRNTYLFPKWFLDAVTIEG